MTTFICGKDGGRLNLRNGYYSLFYQCENYNSQKKCTNHITLLEAKKIEDECIDPSVIYRFKTIEVKMIPSEEDEKIYVVRRI